MFYNRNLNIKIWHFKGIISFQTNLLPYNILLMGDERFSEEWPNIPWSIKPEFSSVWICWSWPLWIGQWWRAVGKEGGGGVRSWRKCHHPVPVQSLHHHHHHHHHCIDKHHRRHRVVIMMLMPIRGRTCRKCHPPVPVLSLQCAEDFSRRPIT